MAGRGGVILAAGLGTRMRSRLPKVLHTVGGRPMVARAADALLRSGAVEGLVVVAAPDQAPLIRELLGEAAEVVPQEKPLGTGHALLAAEEALRSYDELLLVYGDMPLLRPEDMALFLQAVMQSDEGGPRPAAALLSFVAPSPQGYARVLRDGRGNLRRLVEEAEASADEKAISEVNAGVYWFRTPSLWPALHRVKPSPQKGEYYLTDVFADLVQGGHRAVVVVAPDHRSFIGVNDRRALSQAETWCRERTLERLMDAGVTVEDPQNTYVEEGVEVGPDTVLRPGTFLEKGTVIGSGCVIGPGAHIIASRIGDRCFIRHSTVEESQVGDGVQIGPYSHLRPGCVLEAGVEVGNFAELKKTYVGAGTKIHHHSYLGDAHLGPRVNIGAGVITVNYDGFRKYTTEIGEGAFIGCNVNLLAPRVIGKGAIVGAGSTITDDVPEDSLGIARERQVTKPGWAARWRRARKERRE
ncbi:MAG: bifunctional UDP-N-acetylglucosamine diphosphorylase/glucosamine-1-phosphate N-acetyltransferase GlmU [Bacillota bacterium]|nr:bifunctional UDP-N-acetylglucosamine diphosphorylase/glucosamine-1-phosphate N-acetyltransferase GlmU [Bacillota bacterium]